MANNVGIQFQLMNYNSMKHTKSPIGSELIGLFYCSNVIKIIYIRQRYNFN